MTTLTCVHCGQDGHRASQCPRLRTTKAEAHAVLDRARAGHDVSAEEIDAALRATGDLAPWPLEQRRQTWIHDPVTGLVGAVVLG